MKIFNTEFFVKEILTKVATVFGFATVVTFFAGIYIVGLTQGYVVGKSEAERNYIAFLNQKNSEITPTQVLTPSPTSSPRKTATSPQQVTSWGGPQLWEAVNRRRRELGVNALNQRDELCTIASIRLNELLELGTLDGHEGFSNMRETRQDLEWIFERYSTIAEFLAVGGQTPEETVSLWENTLGHKKLLSGGEYVWGCIYAQDTFAVAITAF